jgi:uncharacterized phage protein gp47/JayE
MSFGVTTTGFVRKTFDNIQTSLQTRWKDKLGQNQDVSDDSPNSKIIALMAEAADEIWGVAEDAYNSNNRNSAEGIPLDNALALIGIQRNDRSKATADVSFKGTNTTAIPKFTQVKQPSTGLIFQTKVDSSIVQTSTNWLQFQVNALSNSTAYRIYINGNSYTYTSDSSATYDEIVNGMKSVIDSASLGLTITNVGSGLMTIEATDKNDVYDISASSLFTLLKVQSVIEVECLNYGKNEIPAGSITEISTATAGLDSVNNYFAGEAGADIETDQEARLRGQKDPAVAGFSFVDAIKAKISNGVAGVSYCKVYDNKTMTINSNSIPAKSWEAVIIGGSDAKIAGVISNMEVAGMSSYGNTTVAVKDVDGVPHNIHFTRPTNLYIWVKVTINSYNSEQQFPANGVAAIKQQIIDYVKKFNIGENIITQKFLTPVYNVDGIASATVEIASTTLIDGSPSYATSNINCSIRQKPNFDLTRIVVLT